MTSLVPTLVTFLLDRSSSMSSIKDATIEGFNDYLIAMQREPAGIEFNFLTFDTQSLDKICVNTPIAQVPYLTHAAFQPRGGTPLIDACVKVIRAVEHAVQQRAIMPKVVICFQTDGQELHSSQHTWAELNGLIESKKALGWQFNFLGAGINAYTQAQKMGLSTLDTMSYGTDRAHTKAAFGARGRATMDYASGLAMNMSVGASEKLMAGDIYAPELGGGQPDLGSLVISNSPPQPRTRRVRTPSPVRDLKINTPDVGLDLTSPTVVAPAVPDLVLTS